MLNQPFLTTHDIAELLKVKEPTVRSWIHEQETQGDQDRPRISRRGKGPGSLPERA